MVLKQPESVDECLYFTRRKLLPKGSIIAWALRRQCPKCKKALMKKPTKRAEEYICPSCAYSEPKEQHEAGVVVNVEYVCPSCGHAGEATTDYKRKPWEGRKAYVFFCASCKAKIGITKKLAEAKKKAGAEPEDDEDDE
jgi:predicted RNA-binding Zn-ribbon protein involved in translation (DUF1610 family)